MRTGTPKKTKAKKKKEPRRFFPGDVVRVNIPKTEQSGDLLRRKYQDKIGIVNGFQSVWLADRIYTIKGFESAAGIPYVFVGEWLELVETAAEAEKIMEANKE